MEKQRAKAERRAQKKLAKRDNPEGSGPPVDYSHEGFGQDATAPPVDHEAS